MGQRNREGLDTLLADLQQRWGTTTVRKLGRTPVERVPCIPTGFPAIDRATGIGGFPRGHLTELMGNSTCGAATLALKSMAQAHRLGELTAYLDLSNTFDADYLSRCGADLDKLLVVRPRSNAEVFDMAAALISSGGASLIICDLALENSVARHYEVGIRRLHTALTQSRCALVVLLPQGSTMSGSEQAALRLQVLRQRWLFRNQDVQGFRAQVIFLKNKFAAPHRPISVIVGFSQTVLGDGA